MSGLSPPPGTCVGPHRRVPLPVIRRGGAPQVPVMSGLPLASRGVTTAAVCVVAALDVRVQLGGWFVGLIAALTLAGTGITTYICPVSVSVVVMSRTTAPFLRSVILP